MRNAFRSGWRESGVAGWRGAGDARDRECDAFRGAVRSRERAPLSDKTATGDAGRYYSDGILKAFLML